MKKPIPKTWLELQWEKMPPPRPKRIRHSRYHWEDIYDEGRCNEMHIHFNPTEKIIVQVED